MGKSPEDAWRSIWAVKYAKSLCSDVEYSLEDAPGPEKIISIKLLKLS